MLPLVLGILAMYFRLHPTSVPARSLQKSKSRRGMCQFLRDFVLTEFMWHDAIITTAILRDAQELRDAFLAIDTGDGQLDAFELEEAARKVVPWLALLEQQKSF